MKFGGKAGFHKGKYFYLLKLFELLTKNQNIIS